MKSLFIAIIASAITLFAVTVIQNERGSAGAPSQSDPVYQRIMASGTIRCGYALWGNYLRQDPNTGAFSGIMHDYVTTLTDNLGLTVVWAEEAGWGEAVAGLNNNRFDLWCAGMGWSAARAREIDYAIPFMALKSAFYVRADDTRFDYNIAKLNDPAVTIALIEGEFYGNVLANDFPDAEKLSLPQLASVADLFTHVATGKVDVTLQDSSSAAAYLSNNPGKLREVPLHQPYISVPLSLSFDNGNYKLKRMLDIATQEIIDNGTMRGILARYETAEDTFIRTRDISYSAQ